MLCRKCGRKNAADDKFCRHCGRILSAKKEFRPQTELLVGIAVIIALSFFFVEAYTYYDNMRAPGAAEAKKALQEYADAKFDRGLQVTSFKQISGQPYRANGINKYALRVEAVGVFVKDCEQLTGRELISTGYSESHGLEQIVTADEFIRYKKGSHYLCNGTIEFEQAGKKWISTVKCAFLRGSTEHFPELFMQKREQ